MIHAPTPAIQLHRMKLHHRNRLFRIFGLMALAVGVLLRVAEASTEKLIPVRMSAGPSFIVQLADGLGYFRDEGLAVEILDYHQFVPEDCQIYRPLNNGQLDASLHWFQHVFMGLGEGQPIQGIMLLNDAPGMSVLVANRVSGAIRTAADFKGRNIAEGVPMSTKSFVTNYLTVRAGLPPHSYRSVLQEADGRLEATIKGLELGQVDIVTGMEAVTARLLATGLVTRRFDLTSKASTTQLLGASLPAQCILMAPSYAKAHPEIAQKLVNAFVRAMRYVNGHRPEEILGALPASFFVSTRRAAALDRIENLMPTFARGDYRFDRADVALIRDAVFADVLPDDEEGRLRAHTRKANPPLEAYFDNQFVEKAMAAIK